MHQMKTPDTFFFVAGLEIFLLNHQAPRLQKIFMLNSAEHEKYNHKYNIFVFQYFSFYKQLKGVRALRGYFGPPMRSKK